MLQIGSLIRVDQLELLNLLHKHRIMSNKSISHVINVTDRSKVEVTSKEKHRLLLLSLFTTIRQMLTDEGSAMCSAERVQSLLATFAKNRSKLHNVARKGLKV